jgi:hypothetical protein
MIYPAFNTTRDVVKIPADSEFTIVTKRSATIGYVYRIKSDTTGLIYDVANCDMVEFFKKADGVAKPVKTLESPCKCDSLDLFRYGCKCGAVSADYEARYKTMLQELMGPKIEENE